MSRNRRGRETKASEGCGRSWLATEPSGAAKRGLEEAVISRCVSRGANPVNSDGCEETDYFIISPIFCRNVNSVGAGMR